MFETNTCVPVCMNVQYMHKCIRSPIYETISQKKPSKRGNFIMPNFLLALKKPKNLLQPHIIFQQKSVKKKLFLFLWPFPGSLHSGQHRGTISMECHPVPQTGVAVHRKQWKALKMRWFGWLTRLFGGQCWMLNAYNSWKPLFKKIRTKDYRGICLA